MSYSSLITTTLQNHLRHGAIILHGKVGECDPPHPVLPLTVEPKKSRVCYDRGPRSGAGWRGYVHVFVLCIADFFWGRKILFCFHGMWTRMCGCAPPPRLALLRGPWWCSLFWMTDVLFILDALSDLPRYVLRNSYQTVLDDKSGYDRVMLQETSLPFFRFSAKWLVFSYRMELRLRVKFVGWNIRMDTAIECSICCWGEIWVWGLRLGIEIGDWDWGLRLGIEVVGVPVWENVSRRNKRALPNECYQIEYYL